MSPRSGQGHSANLCASNHSNKLVLGGRCYGKMYDLSGILNSRVMRNNSNHILLRSLHDCKQQSMAITP
eukprot:1125495-Amphidinium_carterae.1